MNNVGGWANVSGIVHTAFHRETCALAYIDDLNVDRAGKELI